MEKLESGYTKEELKEFSRMAFKLNKMIRKTPEGGWEMTDSLIRNNVETVVETVVETTQPKKGFWKRVKNFIINNSQFK
jgi:hypothetical protein